MNTTASEGLSLKVDYGSAIYGAIFIAYCVGLIAYLRFGVQNDAFLGLAARLRKKGASLKSIKIWTVVEVAVILAIPFVIAILWSIHLNSKNSFSSIRILAVFLSIFFITLVIIGFTHWEGNKWYMQRGTLAVFGIAVFSSWAFAFAVSVIGETYSFQGYTAMLFTANFFPICFLVYQKNLWEDNDVKLLFTSVAAEIALPNYNPADDERKLKAIVDNNLKQSNQYFKLYAAAAILIYIATLVVYGVVVSVREETKIKCLGIVTPIFILFCDLVILSLREKPASIDGQTESKEMQITDIIYSSAFQSLVLLLIRGALCFFKNYWLLVYSIIYLLIQIIGAFDLSYAIFTTARVVGNEQEEILRIYSQVPLLQAQVKTQIADLQCHIAADKMQTQVRTVFTRFKTSLAMFVLFLVFGSINLIGNQQYSYLKSEKITFKNTFGQEVWGAFSICLAFLILIYIVWLQAFENDNFRFTMINGIIAGVLEAFSIGLGVLLYVLTSAYNIKLILTTFVLMPIIVVSFSAFYGVWKENDYQAYEKSFEQTQNFNALNYERIQGLTLMQRIRSVQLKPQTKQDWFIAVLLVINFIGIIIYTGVTISMFKPRYVGFTIGVWVLLIELAIICAKKYQQLNYSFMSAEIVLTLVVMLAIYLLWIIILVLTLLSDKTALNKNLEILALVCSGIYFLGGIVGLLINEVQSHGIELKKMSKSFYLQAAIVLLLLVLIGFVIIFKTVYILIGIVWLIAVSYIVAYIFIPARFRWILDIIYAAIFVITGAVTLLVNFKNTPKLLAISLFYFGFFLKAFGQFVRCYLENRNKKSGSILLYGRFALPILQYDLEKKTMDFINNEAYLFFGWIGILLLWGFSATAISEDEYRYFPIALMGSSLAIGFIYIMDTANDMKTLDKSLFRQDTMLFYISCLIAAVENKQQWRSQIKKGEISIQQGDSKNQLGPQYLREINTVKNWQVGVSKFAQTAGWLAYFDYSGAPQSYSDPSKVAAKPQEFEDPEQLAQFINNLKLTENEGEFIDTWMQFVSSAREEILLDTKFWAFLNGYANLRMNQLLEAQSSIVKTSVSLFLEDQLQKLNASGEVQWKQNDKVKPAGQYKFELEQMQKNKQLTKFVQTLYTNKGFQLQYTQFVGQSLLKETETNFDKIDDNTDNEIIDNTDNNHLIDDQNNDKTENLDDSKLRLVNDNLSPADEALKNLLAQEELKKLVSENENQNTIDQLKFQEQQQILVDKLVADREKSMQDKIEKARLQEEERNQRRREAEEARLAELQQHQERQKIVIDEVNIVAIGEDEKLLSKIGDQMYGKQGRNVFEDPEFNERIAKGELKRPGTYERVKNVKQAKSLHVFGQGLSACDIKQGQLGDCYLMSALSVIAHSRPKLLQKLFYEHSRAYQENGMYVVMLYSARQPVVLTLDDKFFLDQSKQHSFVKVTPNANNEYQIWPLLLEKAYAKLIGSYSKIEGGMPSEALATLTNCLPSYYSFKDAETKKMYTSGELWSKLVLWRSKNYLMGCSSPSGSDRNTSSLGIVQGHAYSILDVTIIDGTKLLQIRNPWGDETEWKGAWGDNSKEWTEKRKKIAYERMTITQTEKSEIGKADGIFWISLSDFYTNFSHLYLARYFDQDEYTELFVESQWSQGKMTAGGCSNYKTFPQNPQYKLQVAANGNQQVEMLMLLTYGKKNQAQTDDHGIGFSVFDLGGERIKEQYNDHEIISPTMSYSKSIIHEGKLPATKTPLTLIVQQFKPGGEATFRFTIWYKHQQGSVTIGKF